MGNLFMLVIVARSSQQQSSDIEEARSLVKDKNVNKEDSSLVRNDGETHSTKSLLNKLYLVSALLDIAGYIVRSIGYVYYHHFNV